MLNRVGVLATLSSTEQVTLSPFHTFRKNQFIDTLDLLRHILPLLSLFKSLLALSFFLEHMSSGSVKSLSSNFIRA